MNVLIVIGLCIIIPCLVYLYYKKRNNVDEILRQNLKPVILSSDDLKILSRRLRIGESK